MEFVILKSFNTNIKNQFVNAYTNLIGFFKTKQQFLPLALVLKVSDIQIRLESDFVCRIELIHIQGYNYSPNNDNF